MQLIRDLVSSVLASMGIVLLVLSIMISSKTALAESPLQPTGCNADDCEVSRCDTSTDGLECFDSILQATTTTCYQTDDVNSKACACACALNKDAFPFFCRCAFN